MVVGKGLLAKAFDEYNKNEDIVVFASGVSNSKETCFRKIERNMIDIDDVFIIVKKIVELKKYINQIINIANPNNTKVFELVKTIEKIYNKKANYSLIQKEGNFKIDITQIQSAIDENTIFEYDYLQNRIRKYYE